MRKGIVIGGMIIGLLMGCNNGLAEELEKKNQFLTSISNLGKGFLSVFTDLGDMVSGVLGIKSDTKKEDIGKYFIKIADTVKATKEKLKDIVEKNGNYSKVRTSIDEFISILDTIENGATAAASGATTSDVIGNAKKNEQAIAADKKAVNSLVKGIKMIVGVVLKESEGNAEANKTSDSDKKKVGGLFANTDQKAEAKEENVAKASASIGAVTGADVLKAIAASKENPAEDPTNGIEVAKDAAEIAIAPAANSKKEIKTPADKDAVIAAGIALRAMAKNGKFAANTNDKDADAVNGAVSSAVNKTLSTLIIAIKNTVDSGLKRINEALASVNQGDMLPETSESGASK